MTDRPPTVDNAGRMRFGLAALLVLFLAAPACRRADDTTLHAIVTWDGLTIDQRKSAGQHGFPREARGAGSRSHVPPDLSTAT